MKRSQPSCHSETSVDCPSSSTRCPGGVGHGVAAGGDVHQGVVRAVQYAKTLAGPTVAVRAVYVETDPARTYHLEEKWAKCGFGIPLVILASPYRSLLRPLLEYVDQIQSHSDDRLVTIVLPEFIPRRLWQHLLHNQTALLVKGALLFRRNIVVTDVPYLLKR